MEHDGRLPQLHGHTGARRDQVAAFVTDPSGRATATPELLTELFARPDVAFLTEVRARIDARERYLTASAQAGQS